jgi:hypothetical protein
MADFEEAVFAEVRMFISMCQVPVAADKSSSRATGLHIQPMTNFATLESYIEWCETNGVDADPAVVETCLQTLIDARR